MAFVEASKVGHKEKGSGCNVYLPMSLCVCVCVCALLRASSQALMGLIEGAGSGRETGILCHSRAYLQAIKAESRRQTDFHTQNCTHAKAQLHTLMK